MYARLENRIARIAGFHAGTERGTFDDQSASASTHHHEMVHDRIFFETADGLFHLLVDRIAAQAESRAGRRAGTRLLARLMAETRTAHEAIATCMGIVYPETYQANPDYEERLTARQEHARLPAEYRGHYAIFGHLLDPHLRAPCSGGAR